MSAKPTPSTTTASPEVDALTSDCPYCHSKAGFACRNPKGVKGACRPHAERLKAARSPGNPVDPMTIDERIAKIEANRDAALEENKQRAEWLHKHGAPLNWVVITVEESRDAHEDYKDLERRLTAALSELGPLRELVGVDARCASALSDIHHWTHMMDRADRADAASKEADRLRSELDASLRREGVLRATMERIQAALFSAEITILHLDIMKELKSALGAGSEEGRKG